MVLCSMLAVLKLQMHLQAAVQAQTGVLAKSGKSTTVVPALFVVHDHDALHIDVLLLHILAHPDRCGACKLSVYNELSHVCHHGYFHMCNASSTHFMHVHKADH